MLFYLLLAVFCCSGVSAAPESYLPVAFDTLHNYILTTHVCYPDGYDGKLADRPASERINLQPVNFWGLINARGDLLGPWDPSYQDLYALQQRQLSQEGSSASAQLPLHDAVLRRARSLSGASETEQYIRSNLYREKFRTGFQIVLRTDLMRKYPTETQTGLQFLRQLLSYDPRVANSNTALWHHFQGLLEVLVVPDLERLYFSNALAKRQQQQQQQQQQPFFVYPRLARQIAETFTIPQHLKRWRQMTLVGSPSESDTLTKEIMRHSRAFQTLAFARHDLPSAQLNEAWWRYIQQARAQKNANIIFNFETSKAMVAQIRSFREWMVSEREEEQKTQTVASVDATTLVLGDLPVDDADAASFREDLRYIRRYAHINIDKLSRSQTADATHPIARYNLWKKGKADRNEHTGVSREDEEEANVAGSSMVQPSRSVLPLP